VQEIESALAASNWSLAGSKVHNLKGEAGNLAALKLEAATSQLAECLRAGRHDQAPAHVALLKAAAQECIAARSTLLKRLGQAV
jgi:HPt (histidine-containing phosphotransfer) domain-containing protein